MLKNSKEMLRNAKINKYAIAHFNINNLEWTKYILEESNKLGKPIILGVSESAIKYMGGYKTVYNIVEGLIKDLNITIDVCLHVDHGKSFESCKSAIDAGFTSVMIDTSLLPLAENIKITKQVVEYAHKKNVTVEAEIGTISENGESDENGFAKIEDCIKFVNETNVNSLAPALGSVHGLYKSKPNLQFNTMKELNNKLSIPLVLHGGTGISDEDITKAIKSGISKININTELQVVWHNKVIEYIKNNPNVYDPRKIISSGKDGIKEKVKEKINLFYY